MSQMKELAIDKLNQQQADLTTVPIDKKTASERIVLALENNGGWLAVHELGLQGISDCAASARLRELARVQRVVSRWRAGTRYKEWASVQITIV